MKTIEQIIAENHQTELDQTAMQRQAMQVKTERQQGEAHMLLLVRAVSELKKAMMAQMEDQEKQLSKVIEQSSESVEVTNLPTIPEPDRYKVDISPLLKRLDGLETAITSLTFKVPESKIKVELPEIKVPQPKVSVAAPEVTVEAPNVSVDLKAVTDELQAVRQAVQAIRMPETKPVDLKPLLKAIEGLEGKFNPVIETNFDLDRLVTAINEVREAAAIKYVPPAVTNIDINPLRGNVKTTAVSVTTTATALPATALARRRSIIVYNNDSSTSMFIGGSDVTTNSGIPVAAASFSPPLDLGNSMTLYGIVASGSVNVRVFETSNDATGSS